MNCKAGHEMLAKAKRCHECGETPALDDTMAKCGCGVENIGSARFCVDCGQPMAKAAAADFESAIAELEEFAQARQELTAKASDHSDTDALLEALDSGEQVDAAPILGTFAKAFNDLVDFANESQASSERSLGVFAKAVSAGLTALRSEVLGRIDEIASSVGVLANTPVMRSRAARVELTAKALPNAAAQTTEEDGELPTGQALCKAAVDLEIQGKLQTHDATLTQSYVQRGVRTLGMLAKAGPEAAALANRLRSAIAA